MRGCVSAVDEKRSTGAVESFMATACIAVT